MAKKNFWVACRVCGSQYKNWVGSTPCCGSLASLVDDNGNATDNVVLFGSLNGSEIQSLKLNIPAKN